VRHKKVKFILGLNARCLFGRLEPAMTENVLYILGQFEYEHKNLFGNKIFK